MSTFLLHLMPPTVTPSPPPPEHVRLAPKSRLNRVFKTVSAPPLVASRPQDTFQFAKTIPFSIDESEQDTPIRSEKIKTIQSDEAQRLKEKILEGNQVLAAFNEQAREQNFNPKQKPHKADLVVMAKSEKAEPANFLKKIPLPFHSDGFSTDVIRNYITGQLNGNFLKNYLSNRFALHVNHAKFSITHFHQDKNQHFTESSLRFTRQEKSALEETARAYGYDPNNTQEMAEYYKELLQIQAEITGENKNEQWGIAFHYKKGVFKTKPLELPE